MQIVDVDYFGEKIGMMFSCNDMRSRKVAANDFISYKIKIFKNRLDYLIVKIGLNQQNTILVF